MTEVRHCRVCGEDAAVCVREWKGTLFFGLLPSSRVPKRDFVCQSCGDAFAVEPWILRGFMGLMLGPEFVLLGGLLFFVGLASSFSTPFVGLATAIVGVVMGVLAVFFTIWGLTPAWVARTRPVVPGASVPVVRYELTEPVRRCSCGAPVACVGVTEHRTNLVPTGTEYTYACQSCGREFVVESPWGVVFTVVASTVAVCVGLFLLSVGHVDWSNLACAGLVALLGFCGWLLAAFRLVARFRFPILSQREL